MIGIDFKMQNNKGKTQKFMEKESNIAKEQLHTRRACSTARHSTHSFNFMDSYLPVFRHFPLSLRVPLLGADALPAGDIARPN